MKMNKTVFNISLLNLNIVHDGNSNRIYVYFLNNFSLLFVKKLITIVDYKWRAI